MSAGFNVEDWGPVHAVPTCHRAGAGDRSAPSGIIDRPIPLIIDTDPGLDDALAIGLAAASPEIRLLAVTTVGVNADVTRCTENALRLLHASGRDVVPAAEGLSYRLRRDCRMPNAAVGIVIDRFRLTRLLIDAFARLP